jgi:abortive infection bacteriophage resistance protein
LGIEDKTETDVLRAWLMEMNILRNRCAHHTRIWNQQSSKVLKVTSHKSFEDIKENSNTLSRLYGVIRAMWFFSSTNWPKFLLVWWCQRSYRGAPTSTRVFSFFTG